MKFRFDDIKHKDKEVITKVVFLLRPRRCEDGWWRWLEKVNKEVTYFNDWSFFDNRCLRKKTKYLPLKPIQQFNGEFDKFIKLEKE